MTEEELHRNLFDSEMRRPKAIFFDLGDTILTEISFDPIAGIDRLVGLSEGPETLEIKDIRGFVNELYGDIKKEHEISQLEWPILMLQKIVFEIFQIKSALRPKELEREFWIASHKFALEPGIKDVLNALARNGIPMGIISNSAFSGETLLMELEKYGISEFFDFLISSSDYGVRKPHPTLFLVGASKLSMNPTEAWFIGNSLSHDITGALRVGMGAVWYKKNNTGQPKGPCMHINAWQDFLTLVNDIF